MSTCGIVRIFNTYGPRMRPGDGRVVSNFIVQALDGRAAHGLRRRQPDPQLLLRRRRGARAPRACSTPDSSARSTSATRTSSRCSSSPSSCSRSRDPTQIVLEPLPTDDPDPPPARHHAWPASGSAGSRASTSVRGSWPRLEWYEKREPRLRRSERPGRLRATPREPPGRTPRREKSWCIRSSPSAPIFRGAVTIVVEAGQGLVDRVGVARLDDEAGLAVDEDLRRPARPGCHHRQAHALRLDAHERNSSG